MIQRKIIPPSSRFKNTPSNSKKERQSAAALLISCLFGLFYPEDGGIMFLGNAELLLNNTSS
jgi:hypothetical protein